MSPLNETIGGVLKTYTPWITVGTILWRTYAGAHKSVTAWADTLLDNHFKHLQAALDNIEGKTEDNLILQRRQLEILTKIADK